MIRDKLYRQLGVNMPELPEVETVRQQLRRKVSNKKIAAVEVFHSKATDHNESFQKVLVGQTIKNIERIGKLMIFTFKDDEELFMLSHLKMTGQFFYQTKSGKVAGGGHSMLPADAMDLPNRHTRIAFDFSDSTHLFFNDMRLFGYCKLADREQMLKAKEAFGPEPIQCDFDVSWFVEKLRKRKTSVKAVLLDQGFIAGLGNIYVDEALYIAKVRPTRLANRVTKKEAIAIAQASKQVLEAAIAVGGTTFQHFSDTGGENGNYTDYLKVFGQQTKQCPRKDGGIIQKIRVAGRGTHFCPACQK